MMDLEVWKQSREEMAREAQQNRLANKLRGSRKGRGSGRASALTWEMKRISGGLAKVARRMATARQDFEEERQR